MFLPRWQLRRSRRDQVAAIELSYAQARRYHQTPPDNPSRPHKPSKPKVKAKPKTKPSVPAPKLPFDPTDPRQLSLFPDQVKAVAEEWLP